MLASESRAQTLRWDKTSAKYICNRKIILRWCHLNGSSKLDQRRGLIWEMTSGWQGFSQIIIPIIHPKPNQIISHGPSKKLVKICSFKVHSAKGGGRLWSGCHFWSKGEEQIYTLCKTSLLWLRLTKRQWKFQWIQIVQFVATQPMVGDWNGAGAHTNFSTEPMRCLHIFKKTNTLKIENKNTLSGLLAESKQLSLLLRSSPSELSLYFFSFYQTANHWMFSQAPCEAHQGIWS